MTMKRQKSFRNENEPAIYLVPTPIGNLNEISPRALDVFNRVDVIACEDTRNSGILFKKLGISKPLIAHHEYNQNSSAEGILSLIEDGKSVAVVSDAGYPLVSDPGTVLVRQAIAHDIPVISLSGPNAAMNALVCSGLDTSHYLFYGFLDSKSSRRIRQLESLKEFPYTMIFYEAPHRIEAMLSDLLQVFGDRKICLARELTKIHEEYLRGNISEVLAEAASLKGEIVVVVEGQHQEEVQDPEQALNLAKTYIAQGMKTKAAASAAARETGFSKNDIYRMLIEEHK